MTINGNRVLELLKAKHTRELRYIGRDFLLVSSILVMALVILGALSDGNMAPIQGGVLSVGMFFTAIVVLGRHTFDEYKKPSTGIYWMTLPASIEEKWLASFVASLIGAPIVFIAVATVSVYVAQILLGLFGLQSFVASYNPFSGETLEMLKAYLFMHPILFFGAIYFKRFVVLKTLGALSLLTIILAFYVGFIGDALFGELAETTSAHWSDDEDINFDLEVPHWTFITFSHETVHFGKIAKAFFYTLAYGQIPYFWLMSYLRLREEDL